MNLPAILTPIIYAIGFFATPILLIKLTKKHPDIIDLKDEQSIMTLEEPTRNKFDFMIFTTSVVWPIGLFVIGYNVLYWWYKN